MENNINTTDILFISNFLPLMDSIEEEIVSYLPENKSYKILTYKRTEINNSFSYEEFLESNYERIDNFDITIIDGEYPNINFYLSVVSERMMSDYYMLEGVLGNKKHSLKEVNFIVKSFILFLSPYITNSKLIFSGYADNLISHIAYMLSAFYEKKCLSFHPISVVGNNMNYLSDDIYHKVYRDLIISNEEKSVNSLLEYIESSNSKKSLQNAYKKVRGINKPVLGLFSPNIKKLSFWKYLIFGYKTEHKQIKKYLEIDRVDIKKKSFSYIVKMINHFSSSIYSRCFTTKVLDVDNIIYFPLQVQPEASTSVTSPLFMNLVSTIELISKSLPLGYLLVVKEHPAVKGIRGADTYRKIQSFPNVVLVSNKYSGKELIEKGRIIIGFGGTTLVESVYLGKRFLLLEDSFYSDSKLIRKLKDIRKLREEVLDFLNTDFSDEEKKYELEKMLNFFYQRGFPRYTDFEKNIADNLMKVYEIEIENRK